jgi:hypothetical protein
MRVPTSRNAETICKEISVYTEQLRDGWGRMRNLQTSRAVLVLELRDMHPDTWIEELELRCGIGRSQAYRILAIGEGRTNEIRLRAENRKANRAHRARIKQQLAAIENVRAAETAKAASTALVMLTIDALAGSKVDADTVIALFADDMANLARERVSVAAGIATVVEDDEGVVVPVRRARRRAGGSNVAAIACR